MAIEKFCGSVFWDERQIWNTTNPDFTPCFHKTVFVWVSCGVLWLLTPLEILYMSQRNENFIPWTPKNVFKLVLNLLLLILCISDFIHYFSSELDHKVYPVDLWAPTIKGLTYGLATILIIFDKKCGIHSSGVLFVFWLISTVFGILSYRSYIAGYLSIHETTDEFTYTTSVASFPLVVAQLVLASFPDLVIRRKHDSKECPLKYASFPSLAFFGWFDSLIWKGFKKILTEKDIWTMDDEYKSKIVHESFERIWQQKNKEFDTMTKKKTGFLWMLWDLNRFHFCMAFVLKIFGDVLAFVSPLMLRQLIDFVSNPKEPSWKGYLYTVAMFLASILATTALHNFFFRLQCIGVRARAAVIAVVYRKSLKMSTAAKRSSTTGEIVNLMSVDAQRVMDVWPFAGYLVTTPLSIGIALYLIYTLLGLSVFAGFTVIILLIPLNIVLARITSKLQTRLMSLKDQRIKLTNEILNGIKILKLYAWEPSFEEQIKRIRTKELRLLKKILYLEAVTNFIFQFSPFMIAISTFAAYVLSSSDNILDAAKAFVSISLFDQIRFPLAMVPLIVSLLIQAHTSLKRLDNFMLNDELDLLQVREASDENIALSIENGTFSWAVDDGPTLRNVNLRIAPGSLIAVVGTVGAGKSSLISAILGEMEKISGKISRKGNIAYVSQQAWIQNATVCDNILFGKKMNEKLYNKVVENCALRPDFDMLPGGDQTEIGEKGINLSGGQKQRVSLARAVYANSDIYLLDDPLSAVDAHVGKHIFDKVIGPKGDLAGKTRILVTHGISYLPYVDCIVVISKGTISEIGSYKELLSKCGAFADFLMTYLKEDGEIDEVEAAELLEMQEGLLPQIENKDLSSKLSLRISRALSTTDDESNLDKITRSDSTIGRRSSSGRRLSRSKSTRDDKQQTFSKMSIKDGAVLINKEQMEIGSVGWGIYKYYFKSCGWHFFLIALIMYAFSWTSSVGSNVWLSFWSSDSPNPDGSQNIQLRDLRLGIYSGLGAGQVIFSLMAALLLLQGTVRASSFLHSDMLSNILRSPMSFFDTTPLGRILNRFSRDVDVVDSAIPMFIRPLIDSSMQIIGVIAVICWGTPLFLIALVPLSALYYFIQKVFISTSRQIKRLESVSRSPIFSHFSETLAGLSTIRAYKTQKRFINTSDERVDYNNSLFYPFIIAKRWLAVRLELVGSLVVFCAALLAVIGRDTLDTGTVGLSVSYALSVTMVLTSLVRNWTEVDTNSVSIERLKEYALTPNEAAWELRDFKPMSGWPEEGEMKFHNYSTRYREGLDLVLKGISCDIHSGEKIGIVGRTGAGKSSLTLALFRIIEAAEGSITIDNVNIGKIGLHDLRTRLTIIPQDPVLFFGSLRMNLDPFFKYSDEELWKALEHSHLKSFVTSLPAGLQHEVTEGGENLSVGQRQLLCLARALLRKSKVLILDEATAAVDLETDDLIQNTIRKEFIDCTVITIAHRLNTIMDSTRVMVLRNGVITEFDSPSTLLQNKKSEFYSMAKDAGLV